MTKLSRLMSIRPNFAKKNSRTVNIFVPKKKKHKIF